MVRESRRRKRRAGHLGAARGKLEVGDGTTERRRELRDSGSSREGFARNAPFYQELVARGAVLCAWRNVLHDFRRAELGLLGGLFARAPSNSFSRKKV